MAGSSAPSPSGTTPSASVTVESLRQPITTPGDGFTFDMGPTVLTVPHFIEELFALEPGKAGLLGPDFPPEVRRAERVTSGPSGGPATERYVHLVPVDPFYRIYFDDGTYFDYDGDPVRTREQIRKLAPGDLEGYERFHTKAKAIFERGFLELGYTHFDTVQSMLKVVPDLVRLDAVRPLFSIAREFHVAAKVRKAQGLGGYWGNTFVVLFKNPRRYGGYVVHIGVVFMFLAFTGKAFKHEEKDRLIAIGDTHIMNRYSVSLVDRDHRYSEAEGCFISDATFVAMPLRTTVATSSVSCCTSVTVPAPCRWRKRSTGVWRRSSSPVSGPIIVFRRASASSSSRRRRWTPNCS
mgnify:CR=1 FL=1